MKKLIGIFIIQSFIFSAPIFAAELGAKAAASAQTAAQIELAHIMSDEGPVALKITVTHGTPQLLQKRIDASKAFVEDLVDRNLIANLQKAHANLLDAAQQYELTQYLESYIYQHEQSGEYEDAEYLKNYFKTNIGKGHPIDDQETLQAIRNRYVAAAINYNKANIAFETDRKNLQPIQRQRVDRYAQFLEENVP